MFNYNLPRTKIGKNSAMGVKLIMNRFWKILLSTFAIIFITGTAYALAVPGPHKALCPACYGLTEITPNVFTDDTNRAHEISAMVERSRNTTQRFFGQNLSSPRMILCATDECNSIFTGSIIRGVAYGSRLIRVSPEGLNETIITHELTHTEVFKRQERLGVSATLGGAIPAWFNEGLAVHLSKDDRFKGNADDEIMTWALEFKTYGDWSDRVTRDNWPDAYDGSFALVKHLIAEIGEEGLRQLIEDVTLSDVDFYEAVAPHLKNITES